MREPGIYANVDIDEYHAEAGISSSGIKLILDCPKRYWHEYMNPKPEAELTKLRDKFKMGRALHTYVLEPLKFQETYHMMSEEVNLVTKAGKEIMAAAKESANGKEILRYSDAKDISDIGDSVLSHPFWQTLQGQQVERSVYWDMQEVRLRARPDLFTDEVIIDLKTTDSIANFSKSIHTYGYHRQAAMQIDALWLLDGVQRTFAFFVVEKKAPYLTACFVLDEASLGQGRREYKKGVFIYEECLETGIWPGYIEDFQLISLPEWAIKTDEEYI